MKEVWFPVCEGNIPLMRRNLIRGGECLKLSAYGRLRLWLMFLIEMSSKTVRTEDFKFNLFDNIRKFLLFRLQHIKIWDKLEN